VVADGTAVAWDVDGTGSSSSKVAVTSEGGTDVAAAAVAVVRLS